MKKGVPSSLARPTAGCLPVPLFNQKKRVRQPCTSSPGSAAPTPEGPRGPAGLYPKEIKKKGKGHTSYIYLDSSSFYGGKELEIEGMPILQLGEK